MARFEIDQPHETREPAIEVDASPDKPLAPGKYIFTLQVVDNDGNVSAPAEVTVEVSDPGPVAVLRAPATVPFGQPFQLDGRESQDVAGGRIVRYIWTLVRGG